MAANLKAAEKKIAAFEASQLSTRIPALAAAARPAGAVSLVAADLGELRSPDDVRQLATGVREALVSGGSAAAVVALAAAVNGKPVVIVATTDGSRAAGVKAGALAKLAAGVLGGGGGGKDDLAQGGGTDVGAIPAALEAIGRAVTAG